jgi:hypothetical protein
MNPAFPNEVRRWPMTSEAWSALQAELDRLAADLLPPPDGLLHLPVSDPDRRRRVLEAVRDGAVVDDAGSGVAIGRRVVIREADGTVDRYAVVLPGDGDPDHGWISADSPLGAAVLGARPGEAVPVVAPAGVRRVEVLAVE